MRYVYKTEFLEQNHNELKLFFQTNNQPKKFKAQTMGKEIYQC